jgi:hypothetical protein
MVPALLLHGDCFIIARVKGETMPTAAARCCRSTSSPDVRRERHRVHARTFAAALALGAGALALPALAQQQQPKVGAVTGDASITGVAILNTDIEGGGSFRWDGFTAAGSLDYQVTQALSIGASVRYGYEHWRFSTPTALGPAAPWKNLQMPQVGLNFELYVTPDLSIFASPQLEWDYESGAGASNAKTYGAIFGVTKIFSPKLVLGIGAGVYRQIDETQAFPVVIVRWQIDDKWLLRNSLSSGPAGGPGVELAYAINDQWEFSAGGAYREYRFRLSDDGPVPGGVGENRGIPLFAKLSAKLGKNGTLDFVAGALVGGELKVIDRNGNTLSQADYKTSPLLGITAKVDF